MIEIPFNLITKENIETLKENAVHESRTIEYKLELPGITDVNKKEFLADISSFANASGGDILFGIKEEDGVPVEMPGLAKINIDEVILRLESLIRDGLEPRIPGIHVQSIGGFEKGSVLHIRVLKSWMAPHMVCYKNTSRFYSRTSAGKNQLDVTELRSAFAESEELPKKIERFIDGRLGKIIAGETPMPLIDKPKMILHVLPFSAFGRSIQIAVPDMKSQNNNLRPFDAIGYNTNINVDGLITYDSSQTSYCQLFRSGQIETIATNIMVENGRKKFIPSLILFRCLSNVIPKYLLALKELNVPEPIVLRLSMVGAKGYELALERTWTSFRPKLIDRDVLLLPEAVVQNYDENLHEMIKPILDGIWNACGYESCNFYDANGQWITPKRQ